MFTRYLIPMLLAGSTAAGAVTWVSPANGPDQGALASETYVVDFNTSASAPSATLAGFVYATNAPGVAASPFGDTTPFLGVNGTYTLDVSSVGTGFKTFSFYWGSVDDGNTVEVLDLANNVLLTLTGAELPQFDGNQELGETNRRVFFTLGAGETLGGVRFTYNNAAFELDDVAFGVGDAVPEPATWALLLAGFGMVGAAARRRRYGVAA